MLKSLCIALHLCTTIAGYPRVIDGDTISVQGIHVRLYGEDAEELIDPHGIQARKGLEAIIGTRKVVCHLTGEKSYNRYIGKCFLQGQDVAEKMIQYGFALDCKH